MIGQNVFISERGRIPDYLGRITKIIKNTVYFKPYRAIDEYFLNDKTLVIKYERDIGHCEMTCPKSFIMPIKVYDNGIDDLVFIGKNF